MNFTLRDMYALENYLYNIQKYTAPKLNLQNSIVMAPTANANFVLQMQSIALYAFTVPNAEKHEGTYRAPLLICYAT